MKVKEKIRFKEAASWTGSSIIYGSPQDYISQLSTDTRSIEAGDFFIPVKGPNFDGHDFIADAVRAGASGFIYEKAQKARTEDILRIHNIEVPGNLTMLESSSNMEFLKGLAAAYLRQFNLRSIGITGSVGKTTVKNLIAGILSKRFNVVHTPRNFNTEIGVSKTIFSIDANTDFFIVELGMRGPGQIRPLAEIADLEIGAITSIGDSHMEFFDNIEDIAAEKAGIATPVIRNRGKLFLNADDKMSGFIREITGADIIVFGEDRGTDYNFINKGSDSWGRFSFDFCMGDIRLGSLRSGLPGSHNLYNACLAAAICHYLGADIDIIREGIEKAEAGEHRMSFIGCPGMTILDDCYNASPVSVSGAIDLLSLISRKNKRRSVAILGDMLELGRPGPGLHYDIGCYCAKKDIDVLIASGKLAKNIFRGFKNKKGDGGGSFYFRDKNSLRKNLDDIIRSGDIILVKGSRANKLEDIVLFLQK